MFRSSKGGTHGTDTLIGKGTEIEGKVTCATNLRVEGKIKGDVQCANDVTIGESSVLHSNITAKNIVIAGQVNGNLHVQERLTIMPTGQLNGDFTSQSLIIHEGGIFNGSSNMSRQNSSTHKKDADSKSNKADNNKAESK